MNVLNAVKGHDKHAFKSSFFLSRLHVPTKATVNRFDSSGWKLSSRCHTGPSYWHLVYQQQLFHPLTSFCLLSIVLDETVLFPQTSLAGLWIASLPKQMRSKSPGCKSWKRAALHCEDWQVTTTPEQRVGHPCGQIPLRMLVFPSHHNLSKFQLPLKGLAAENSFIGTSPSRSKAAHTGRLRGMSYTIITHRFPEQRRKTATIRQKEKL